MEPLQNILGKLHATSEYVKDKNAFKRFIQVPPFSFIFPFHPLTLTFTHPLTRTTGWKTQKNDRFANQRIAHIYSTNESSGGL